jgi:hypothetical protein
LSQKVADLSQIFRKKWKKWKKIKKKNEIFLEIRAFFSLFHFFFKIRLAFLAQKTPFFSLF